MNRKVIEAKEALKRIFTGFPQSLELREVRAHIYQAYQKIESLEKAEEKASKYVSAISSRSEIVPFRTNNPDLVKQTIDKIDEMIRLEEQKIEEIKAKKGKKDEPESDNSNETYLG